MTYVIPFKLPAAAVLDIKAVYTGEKTIAALSKTITDSISVTKNKSFLVFQYEADFSGDDPEDMTVWGEITNNTTVTFGRQDSANGDIIIRYWIVEFKAASAATVQHGSKALASATENVTISAVSLTNAFPLISWEVDGTNLNDKDFVSAEITTTTNLQLQVKRTSVHTVKWQVINCPNWTVKKYTSTISGTSQNVTLSPTVTQAETWIVATARTTTEGPVDGGGVPQFNLTSSSNINIYRDDANQTFYFIIYVIEGAGKFAVQHQNGETIASGASTGSTSLSPNISLTNSLLYMGCPGVCQGNNETNTSAAGECLYIKHKINSVSQSGQERYSNPAAAVRFSFQSVDFSAAI